MMFPTFALMEMNRAYLILGSNLGDRCDNLLKAEQLIGERVGSLYRASSVYETGSWGLPGPQYLNRILLLKTFRKADEVLRICLAIEEELGRRRSGLKNEPRVIDIDLLFYNEDVIDLPGLEVPHPRIPERRFVLVPLVEISPCLIHPLLNRSMKELLSETNDKLEVRRYECSERI